MSTLNDTAELLRVLEDDGVDLERFYPCAYEQEESGGGWLPVTDAVAVPLVPPRADDDTAPPSRRRWEHAPRSAPQRRRIDQALKEAGPGLAITPLMHGYGPAADFSRRFAVAAAAVKRGAAGGWINRYGYLSDEKLAAIGRLWKEHAL